MVLPIHRCVKLYQHFEFCSRLQLLFAKEAIFQSKLDEIEEIADKILPTLSSEESSLLKADISNLSSRLADTATRSRDIEEKLQDGVNNWQDFVSSAVELKSALTGLQERAVYQSPSDLASAKDNEQLNQVKQLNICIYS